METLKIDDKWSVEYDPANNDRPKRLLRYGEEMDCGLADWTNDVLAMFYALLEARRMQAMTEVRVTASSEEIAAIMESSPPFLIDLDGTVTEVVRGKHRLMTSAGDLLPALKVKRLRPGAQLPSYETPGAAGADVRAYLSKEGEVRMRPGERRLFKTGIILDIPPGFEVQVRPRSGLAFKHGVTVLNAPGTIDSDYKQELGVILHNTSDIHFRVFHGDRIAQIVFAPVIQARIVETDSIEENGRGGFGHTGVK